MAMEIVLVVDKALTVQQQMTQFVHHGEGLGTYGLLLFDKDDWKTVEIQGKTPNGTFLGDLPLPCIAVTHEDQNILGLHSCPHIGKTLPRLKPEPGAGQLSCLLWQRS